MPAESLANFEKAVSLRFRNKDLLAQALTHRSAVRQSKALGHNERFEFLGDAVLELVTTEYVFSIDHRTEGEMTNMRSALVKGENLSSVAREIGLGKFISMSRGEERSGGREKSSMLANSLEAVIGAIYLDQGFERAREFCYDYIFVRLKKLMEQGKDKDEKSLFQEKAQEATGITPHYRVLKETGPDHDKTFLCAAFLGKKKVSEGKGKSKQAAETDAARNALASKAWK